MLIREKVVAAASLCIGIGQAVQHPHHDRPGVSMLAASDMTGSMSLVSADPEPFPRTSQEYAAGESSTTSSAETATTTISATRLMRLAISESTNASDRPRIQDAIRRPSSSLKAKRPADLTGIPRPIRGVNIGSWLILEPWMVTEAMIAPLHPKSPVDQWSFDQIAAKNVTIRKLLTKHWNTFFTEADVRKIKSWGLNTIRIPIGYWAYHHYNKDPFISGADKYLERAIGWCSKYGLRVIIDLHGAPGSQNGAEHSGHQGDVGWYRNGNMGKTIAVLKQIVKKYTTPQFRRTVIGIELTNEPSGDYNAIRRWAVKAYRAVQEASSNPNLIILMHDGWFNPSNWKDIGVQLNGPVATLKNAHFWIDSHLYQNQGSNIPLQNQKKHIQRVCDWSTGVFLDKAVALPVIVGEFSAQTYICAYLNGTIVGGNDCNVAGCQCAVWAQPAYYNAPLKRAVRQYLEAELSVFEKYSKGWIIWSYKAEPGVWSLLDLVTHGIMPQPLTSRKYGKQC